MNIYVLNFQLGQKFSNCAIYYRSEFGIRDHYIHLYGVSFSLAFYALLFPSLRTAGDSTTGSTSRHSDEKPGERFSKAKSYIVSILKIKIHWALVIQP